MRPFVFVLCLFVLVACGALLMSCDDDDDDNDNDDNDVADDDDDVVDDDTTDDDIDDDDDDTGDDDTTDDDTGDDDTTDDDTTPQDPLYEKGMILPPDSLECYPEGAPPTNDCNHHGSAVAVLPDGTVAAVWYHGYREKSPDARIVWSLYDADADEWSWPEVLYDDPGRSEGNPTLWIDEDGVYYVFFVSIYGDGWNQSKVRLITSTDDGATWSDPVMLRNRYCWMTRHRPQRLDNGELLLPLYNECLAIPVFMRSPDNFATWTEEGHMSLTYFLEHMGQIQPALGLLDDGTLTAMTRDGFPTRRVKRMVSEDNGVTWTPSRITELPNSGTSIDQVVLANGHVVVVYNDSPETRFPLTVALSLDGGATFVARRNIDDECAEPPCSYSYPSIIQHPDRTIWVTYSHERDTISYVRFNEEWLAEGE